jgi:hypothetical protein
MPVLQLVGNIVLIAATIPAVLFVILYARARWESSQIGRQTMALSVVIASVLVLSILRIAIHDTPVFLALRLFAFAMIVPTLWWRLYLLLVSQRQGVHWGTDTDQPEQGGRVTEPTSNETTSPLHDLEPVETDETTLPPTGEPPEDWDQEVHADEFAADPAVSEYEDKEV